MNTLKCVNHQYLIKDFNEAFPKHTWSPFQCYGSAHLPIFKVYLYLNNNRFEGCGSSKKNAQKNAILKFQSSTPDYQSNNSVVDNNKTKCVETFAKDKASKILSAKTKTSTVTILHDLFPEHNFVFDYEEFNGLNKFVISVSSFKFIGIGNNKKEAKENACRKALINLSKLQQNIDKLKDCGEKIKFHNNNSDADITNHFAYITNSQYQKLEFKNKKYKEYSVLASIIKVNNK